jgi:hypothetical protein
MHPEMKIHYQKMSPNKLSVVNPHAFDSSFSQGGGDQINYGTTIFNRCSHQVWVSYYTHDLLDIFFHIDWIANVLTDSDMKKNLYHRISKQVFLWRWNLWMLVFFFSNRWTYYTRSQIIHFICWYVSSLFIWVCHLIIVLTYFLGFLWADDVSKDSCSLSKLMLKEDGYWLLRLHLGIISNQFVEKSVCRI